MPYKNIEERRANDIKNRERIRARERKQYAENEEFREKRKAKCRSDSKRRRTEDPDAVNAKARANHAKRMEDPNYAKKQQQKFQDSKKDPIAVAKRKAQTRAYYEKPGVKERLLARQRELRGKAKTDSELAEKFYRQQRNADLKRQYGITLEDYERMHSEQNGLCAICCKPETLKMEHTNRTHALAVDHDHGTGEVRGLLCGPCNKALGNMKDDPVLLVAAAAYLWKAEGKTR